MLLAFDDTDSAAGGCTTALVTRLLAAMPALGLRSMPRLVRLNPNVPHKTRGNGAVVLELCLPTGPKAQVGMAEGKGIGAFPDGEPVAPTQQMLDDVWAIIVDACEDDADPGVAIVPGPLPAVVYWQGVRSEILQAEAEAAILASGGFMRGGRGVIGAAAALAWPGPATSHELLAYRRPDRIGQPRNVNGGLLGQLDDDGTTFHSHDPALGVPACIPHTPCPVLAGLRGLDAERLRDHALPMLKTASTEAIDSWLLFASNQASGDHVSPVDDTAQAPKWSTIRIPLTVMEMPTRERGGHAGVACHDALGHGVDVVAFEPTKGMRDVVCNLRPGDHIVAVGAWRDRRIHLERLEVVSMAVEETKVENPSCTRCGKSMKSRGKDAGYRCPNGHGDAPETAAVRLIEQRHLRTGWYEVPVMARRHLHRPLAFDALAD